MADAILRAVDRDLSTLPVVDEFRMRGESVSRLETFVDAAFAFAVTLMVISVGEMPHTAEQLLQALHRTPTFAVCFLIMMIFWDSHNQWSRRYGLETPRTTMLSLALVLVVLIWVYPQRMVMSSALSFMTGGWVPSDVDLKSFSELQDCFLVYGLGFGALSLILMELDREALKKADELSLDVLERLETKRELGAHAVLFWVACLSVALTFVARYMEHPLLAAIPGFTYGLIGPALRFHHARFHKLRKALPPRILR